MRATTCSTPKVSRATRATRMLELSPFVTAATAPACSMPASISRSRSKPMPCTVRAGEVGAEPGERLAAPVDDRDGVPVAGEGPGERRADPAASDDDDVHGRGVYELGTPLVRMRHRRPAGRPTVPLRMVSLAKRLLIGRPIATSEEGHQRLRKRVALPIFASDAISSTAYATDEILLVLSVQAGVGARGVRQARADRHRRRASCCVIVVLSYRQTIYAYPSGGGAYVVSRENLGEMPSLVAGASLLTDYILTVAVSVAGGVLAIQSAFDFDSSVARAAVPRC